VWQNGEERKKEDNDHVGVCTGPTSKEVSDDTFQTSNHML